MPLDRPQFSGFERRRQPRALGEAEGFLVAVRDNIVRFGWHIQAVFTDPGRIGWHYTIGFGDAFGHPDLVVFGLDDRVAQILLNDIGDALAAGATFTLGQRYSEFLVDVDIEFRATLPRWNEAHFGRARDWYGEYGTMWQVVLPDRRNRFPGEPDEQASRFQVLLSSERPAPGPMIHAHTPIEVPDGQTALVPDLLGDDETGWEELVVLVEGTNEARWVVVSVPYVDHIAFGDEVEVADEDGELRVVRASQRAPVATVRLCVLRDETRAALDQLIKSAEANEIAWESPVQFWFFFAVPHHRFPWFMEQTQPLVDQHIVGRRVARAPTH